MVGIFWPPSPPVIKEWAAAFHTLRKDGFGGCLKTFNASKICFAEVTKADIERTELRLKDSINVLAVFGGVREAARVVKPRSLLERRRDRPWRWSRFGHSEVDLLPDKRIVYIIANSRLLEGLEMVEVKVARDDRGI